MVALLKPLEGLYENIMHSPDTYKLKENVFSEPDPNFVISRDNKGNTISIYSDNRWDFSTYVSNPSQHGILIFLGNIKEKRYISEAKKILFVLMIFGSGRNGSSYSIETLKHYFFDCITRIYKFAKGLNKTITAIFENNNLLLMYIEKECYAQNHIVSLSSILKFLDELSSQHTMIKYKKSDKVISAIRKNRVKYSQKQTTVIPSRILVSSIKERWLQISKIEKNLDNISNFIKRFISSDYFAMSTVMYYKKKAQDREDVLFWDESVSKLNLNDIFLKYNVINIPTFKTFIKKIQGTCKHLIHAYSGMRNGEVLSLKCDCIENVNNNKIVRLLSSTSKLHGSKTDAKWVTTKELERVVNILKFLNKPVADFHNISLKEMPLFIASSFFERRIKGDIPKKLSINNINQNDYLEMDSSQLMITEEDINELDDINFSSNWKSEDNIEEGKVWKFKSHQYRRSLAIYSIQSGLVSLGALQIQFKHLFREMTLYYGNGASYAKKLFDISKEHIANDFDKLKPEIETLEYIKNVIFSDEQLFGTHGTFIERNVKNKNTSQKDYILENREKTLQQFKKGEIAYKETALGGCISTEACDYALTRSIVACGGCDSSIIKKSKLDNVINKQKEFIEFLDKDSIEYRTEMGDLEELEKQRKQFLGSKA